MKLLPHPDTERCSDLFDKLAGVLKDEDDPIVRASALSLLLFDYAMHQDDPADTVHAFQVILDAMLDSFDHGVGPRPKTTH